jgi:hypothetical protein
MRTAWMALIGLVAMTLAACTQDPNSPEGVIRGLFAPYVTPGGAPQPLDPARNYSADLKKLDDTVTGLSQTLDEKLLDFNPLTFSPDGAITALTVAAAGPPPPGKTLVAARFRRDGTPTTIVYTLVKEGPVWKLDDINYGGGVSLRESLVAAIRPAGAAENMFAPIRAIYQHYADSTPRNPVKPLHEQPGIGADFAALLRRGAERAADPDGPVLPIDPVVDSQDFQLADVRYQAVGGAVIVRFTNRGAPTTLVYDLVYEGGEQGAWKIQNIRKPGDGGWSVRGALANAGITR